MGLCDVDPYDMHMCEKREKDSQGQMGLLKTNEVLCIEFSLKETRLKPLRERECSPEYFSPVRNLHKTVLGRYGRRQKEDIK